MGLISTILLAFQTSDDFVQQAPKMTVGGWAFMAGAWIFIIWLTCYTFAKILRGSKK